MFLARNARGTKVVGLTAGGSCRRTTNRRAALRAAGKKRGKRKLRGVRATERKLRGVRGARVLEYYVRLRSSHGYKKCTNVFAKTKAMRLDPSVPSCAAKMAPIPESKFSVRSGEMASINRDRRLRARTSVYQLV